MEFTNNFSTSHQKHCSKQFSETILLAVQSRGNFFSYSSLRHSTGLTKEAFTVLYYMVAADNIAIKTIGENIKNEPIEI